MPKLITPAWSGLLSEMVEAGMTQKQIAEAVGMSQASISDLLRGEVKTTEYARGLRIIAAHRAAMKSAAKRKPASPVLVDEVK